MRLSLVTILSAISSLSLCFTATADSLPPGPTPERIRSELDLACQAGQAHACLDLGEALEQIRWAAGSQAAERANQAFDRACELGSCQGCLAVGDYDRTAHVCIAPCEAGDRRACFGLMTTHRYEDAAQSRPQEAARWAARYMALSQTACDAGDPLACHDLGIALMIGYPDITTNFDAARTAFAQAGPGLAERCEAGHVGACALIVSQHTFLEANAQIRLRRSGSVPSEPAVTPSLGLSTACRLLRRDCATGNWGSCSMTDQPPCLPSEEIRERHP